MASTSPDLRFKFGENWTRFLSVVDDQRISEAERKLHEALGDIRGKTFLDIGCGSGIHSLAAVRLGAARVFSFDYDSKSVSCSQEMRRRFASDSNWHIEQGSALDETYVRSLGQFDVVYSWGVLHHTGDMWKALDLAAIPSKEVLMVAIYNDEGRKSRIWKEIKSRYVRSGIIGRRMIEYGTLFWGWGLGFMIHPRRSFSMWKNYAQSRGMSPWYDVIDWAGGYPFEVARPDQIFKFFQARGFALDKMGTVIGHGCNEFTFHRAV